jgi:hypothetical protein
VCGWTEQLGFKVEHNPKTSKTKLTAPKHIEALKQFVSKDLHVTPRLPCSETLKGLSPEKVLEPQEPGYEQQQQKSNLCTNASGISSTLPKFGWTASSQPTFARATAMRHVTLL